jgi:hypothetical protein
LHLLAWQTFMEVYAQEGRAVLTVPLVAATGQIASNLSASVSPKECATMYSYALALSQHCTWSIAKPRAMKSKHVLYMTSAKPRAMQCASWLLPGILSDFAWQRQYLMTRSLAPASGKLTLPCQRIRLVSIIL